MNLPLVSAILLCSARARKWQAIPGHPQWPIKDKSDPPGLERVGQSILTKELWITFCQSAHQWGKWNETFWYHPCFSYYGADHLIYLRGKYDFFVKNILVKAFLQNWTRPSLGNPHIMQKSQQNLDPCKTYPCSIAMLIKQYSCSMLTEISLTERKPISPFLDIKCLTMYLTLSPQNTYIYIYICTPLFLQSDIKFISRHQKIFILNFPTIW